MNTALDIPREVRSIVIDPSLTDEEFEKLCGSIEFFRLERTKEGKIIVNPPTGLDSGSSNSEIVYQLRA
jgi:Uma2 family endonuclease